MLGGVLQELRGEVQEVRAAVGEARRQAVRSAGLATTWVMVVVVVVVMVVSVRHHPSHQSGHGVFNLADHHSARRSAREIKNREAMIHFEAKKTNDSPVTRIISGSVFVSSSAPCDSFFQTSRRDVFLIQAELKTLSCLRVGCDPADGYISSLKAGLHRDV